ncbi:MAG: PAS domain S-box protein [Deltaproteobacteria bacterium]|nr:PAS domain S-box protein [Deltaproteobacteria bacterium]
MKSSLFLKIFGTYIIIIVMAMAVVGFLVTGQIKTRLKNKIESDLTAYAKMISLTCPKREMEERLVKFAELSGSRITIIDEAGNVLVDSEEQASKMENHINRTEIQEARLKGTGTAIRYGHTLGIDTLYVAAAMLEDSGIKGYVRLSRPLSEIKKTVTAFNVMVFRSFAFVGVISFFIAFIFSSRLSSPIQEMEKFTRKLRDGYIEGSLLIDSSDEMGRLARNINDIMTELKKKAQLANEEKGKLEAAFASMNDGTLILDNNRRIEAFNNALKEIFGIKRLDIYGRTPLESFRNIELENMIDRFRETGMPVAEEIKLAVPQEKILDVSISPIHGLPKGEEKVLIVFHDVTRLKKLEKMRGDFVANVTHEIKTPLTAILGFVETLQGGAVSHEETALKFLDTIRKHAERLNRLVDDLFTISDIELGEMRFFFEKVSLGGIIDSVLSIVEARAEEKHIRITKEISDDLPAVRADRDRLNQILLNVLDNAVKYTPDSGSISVNAFFQEDSNYVVVKISDTGIGIPKRDIPRLGERFYRADKTRSRELGGTGLGLSIVKHLMMAHNGNINFESRPGAGTAVSLSLPAFNETGES